MNHSIRNLAKCLFGVLCTLPIAVFAGNNPDNAIRQMSLFERMSQRSVVEITLELDLGALLENVNTDDYMPARFIMKEGKKDLQLKTKVKPRGKYRRRVCDFPPLKLKFSKDDLTGLGLAAFNKIKLVTHCLDDKALSEELVMREYLTYQLYNEITPYSFRVQLAKITYVDIVTGDKIRRWGFFIEPTEEMAARVHGVEVEEMGLSADLFHPTLEKIASTFQYMIGNEDYNLEICKNVKIIRSTDTAGLIPVPYDFDFSGIVMAPYARPRSELNHKSVRDRHYLGLTPNRDDLYATFSYFKTKKKAIFQRIYQFPYLSNASKADIAGYIESFYEIIEAGSEIPLNMPVPVVEQ